MKTNKINFLATAGIAIAMATAAFTMPQTHNVTNDDPLWFHTGNTTATEDNQTSYRLAEEDDACPGTVSVNCIIQAPEDGSSGLPDLDNKTILSKKQ